jgi:hypothetical protein
MELNWQERLGRTNRILALLRHGSRTHRHVQKLFHCFLCIRYQGNVLTEQFPSDKLLYSIDSGYTDWLENFVKYARRWDRLSCRVQSSITISSAIRELMGCGRYFNFVENEKWAKIIVFSRVQIALSSSKMRGRFEFEAPTARKLSDTRISPFCLPRLHLFL